LNYLAGVDEAGLGPILGPLVVAGVAMAGRERTDPWAALGDLVCRHRTEKGKIRVADSKKVNTGDYGFDHLEHTALSFLGAWRGELPETLAELLAIFGVEVERLAPCPWYRALDLPLPLRNDRDLLELRAYALERALRREGIEILHLATLLIDVEEWNALIAETNNKSRAHFRSYARVIGELVALLPHGGHLVADRCGGIMRYLPALRRTFPDARIRRLREQEAESSYTVLHGERRVKISFAVGGEDRAFPTALASCMAKYVRELMLHLINEWFRERMPDLAPTAGYYRDGRRFLKDVAPLLASDEVPRARLVRTR